MSAATRAAGLFVTCPGVHDPGPGQDQSSRAFVCLEQQSGTLTVALVLELCRRVQRRRSRESSAFAGGQNGDVCAGAIGWPSLLAQACDGGPFILVAKSAMSELSLTAIFTRPARHSCIQLSRRAPAVMSTRFARLEGWPLETCIAVRSTHATSSSIRDVGDNINAGRRLSTSQNQRVPMTQGRDLTATDTDATRIKQPVRPSRTARLAALAMLLPGSSALAAAAPGGTPDA